MGDRLNALESTYDVVVVGAGIVGAACAHYLMEEGLRIAVLEQGVLTEQGTHEQLMRRGGAYARLYQIQFGSQATSADHDRRS